MSLKSRLSLATVAAISALGTAGLSACAPVETAATPSVPASGPKVCRADNYQRFIGRNRSELPAMPADENWRVLCSTCAATMDYREDRLTVTYDTTSGVVQSARCG